MAARLGQRPFFMEKPMSGKPAIFIKLAGEGPGPRLRNHPVSGTT